MLDTPHTDLHDFDAATALEARDGRLVGRTSDAYFAFVGPFGGITAAAMLRAVLAQGEAEGDPLAFTIHFCAPIASGAFDIACRLVKANRSTQHWAIELSQAGQTGAFATAVLAARRPSWSHQPAAMPQASAYDATPVYAADFAMPWVRRFEFRFAEGALRVGEGPHAAPASPRSKVWIGHAAPRPLDMLSLVAFGDAFFGRIFHVRGELMPFGTVAMTTYFHVDAADLAAENARAVLGVADASAFHKSYGDQTGELWSPSGRLLATTQQIAYFKA